MQPKVGNSGPPPILQSVKSLPPSRWVEVTAMTLHPEKGSSPVQFSRSLMSSSLQHHGMQHARPPCPSPTPEVKLTSIESVMPSNHLILCRPLLFPPSIFPSIRVFSNKSVLHIRWPSIGVSASASVLMNIQD